jgi:hypothetical protein
MCHGGYSRSTGIHACSSGCCRHSPPANNSTASEERRCGRPQTFLRLDSSIYRLEHTGSEERFAPAGSDLVPLTLLKFPRPDPFTD